MTCRALYHSAGCFSIKTLSAIYLPRRFEICGSASGPAQMIGASVMQATERRNSLLSSDSAVIARRDQQALNVARSALLLKDSCTV